MENAIRSALLPDVFLTTIKTDKFKSGVLSINILRPISEAEASMNALIPTILRRGSENHPDMVSLAAEMDELYGASVGTVIRKRGETQVFGLTAEFNDDKYIPNVSGLLEKVFSLAGEILLRPVTENGMFKNDYFESEKKNLLDVIAGRLNDKTSYCQSRLIETMCANEAYGVDKLGSAEACAKITNQELYNHYLEVLKTSRFELIYVGGAEDSRVRTALMSAISDLPRGEVMATGTVIAYTGSEPKYIEQRLDVTQGKLSMGFRTGVTASDEDYPAMALFNAVYGGSLTSKLFMNVRERLSLCYYANSGVEKYKGLLLVNSGVEFDKFQTARDEILSQLEACKRGEISDEELEGARRYLINSLNTAGDSLFLLEEYALGRILGEYDYTPAQLAAEIKDLSVLDVIKAAKKVRLDTVYFLRGLDND